MDHIAACVNAMVIGAIIFMWAVYLGDHPRVKNALTDTPSYSTGLVIRMGSK